ncbi:MAG: hypothetical protein ACRYGG_00970, partial [Janthinobacterium lividum]
MSKLKVKKSKSIKGEIVSSGRTRITVLDLLEEKVNLSNLLDSVYLEEERLIEAALEQPKLVLDAGKFRVQKFHKKTVYDTALKSAQADAGLRLRRIRDTGGKKEFTEAAVKERIELDPQVKKLRRKLDAALAEE